MKKKEATDSTKAVQEESSSYGPPIYLTLNGNGWDVNSVYLTVAIEEAQEYNSTLYVTSNVGGPNNPPPCPPGFPNCRPE